MYFLGEQCTAGVIHSQTSYPQLTALQSGRAATAPVPGSADSLRVCTYSTDSLSLCLKSIGHFYRKQPFGKRASHYIYPHHGAIICHGPFPSTLYPAPRRGQVNQEFRPSTFRKQKDSLGSLGAHTRALCKHPAGRLVSGKDGLQEHKAGEERPGTSCRRWAASRENL